MIGWASCASSYSNCNCTATRGTAGRMLAVLHTYMKEDVYKRVVIIYRHGRAPGVVTMAGWLTESLTAHRTLQVLLRFARLFTFQWTRTMTLCMCLSVLISVCDRLSVFVYMHVRIYIYIYIMYVCVCVCLCVLLLLMCMCVYVWCCGTSWVTTTGSSHHFH